MAAIRVRKELSHKMVSLALVYSTSATLHKASLDKELCTGLLALRPRFFSGEVHSLDSYCTEFYNAVFALLEEVRIGATAAICALRDFFMTQIPVPGSEKTMNM